MRYSLVFSLCLLIVAMLASATVFSESLPFDKIFTTSQERKALDQLRAQKNTTVDSNASLSPVDIESAIKEMASNSDSLLKGSRNIGSAYKGSTSNKISASQKISLSGFIVRSDGQQKIWLNGKELSQEKSLDAKVSSSDKKDVILTAGEKTISLKVGQKWLEKSDTIIETYKRSDNKANE